MDTSPQGLDGTTMLDAAQAFRYARGAVWHLEVALPQLAAAGGPSPRAGELAQVAASHIDKAAADLAATHVLGHKLPPVGDRALGASLIGEAARLRAGTAAPDAVAEVVRAARQRVQHGVDSLAPHLRSDQELLPLAPAADAPLTELALVDQVADARRFKLNSDVQRAVIQRILAEGEIDPEPIRMVGGYGNGNGQMAMVRVRHPETPHLSVVAVQRPGTAQAGQEEFFARLSEHAGTDHHFAPVARRSDGSALVLAIRGSQLWDDVHSGDEVADLMGSWYSKRFATLPSDDARRAGRIDFDETMSLDYVTAHPDRNAGSPLGDPEAGLIGFIDNGFAGRGETHDPLRPGLKSHFVGGVPGRATLLPEAASNLAARLDDAALADAHAILRRGPDGDLPSGHALALRQDASQGFLDAMRARRDQIRTGSYRYEPIELNANPLAHMDWLQGGRRPF